MGRSIFLFNTSTLEKSDILTLIKLLGFAEGDDFKSQTEGTSECVSELLRLINIYFERKGKSITFDKFIVHPSNEHKNVEDVVALKDEIRFVFDKLKNEWFIVTMDSKGERLQKEISQLNESDAKEPSLMGINIPRLQLILQGNSLINSAQWNSLKNDCFVHPNPIHSIGQLLRKSIDGASNQEKQKIIEVRQYLNNKAQKFNISLILYSNQPSADACGKNECLYVKDILLREVKKKDKLKLLYIGAGHGWSKQEQDGMGMLSALPTKVVEDLILSLRAKEVGVYGLIVLGSCFSASYSEDMSSLLEKKAVMLSTSLSQGGENFFSISVSFLINNQSFFRNIAISQGEKIPTGFCITQRDKHLSPRLCKKNTGLPPSSADDEYCIHQKITEYLQEMKPKSIFINSLDQNNEYTQKITLNKLVGIALNQSFKIGNNFSLFAQVVKRSNFEGDHAEALDNYIKLNFRFSN